MRVALDHLLGDPRRYLINIKVAFFLGKPGMEEDLEEQIPKLLFGGHRILPIDRFQSFKELFHQVGSHGEGILLPIPGTVAAQSRHQAPQGFQGHDKTSRL